MAPLLASLILTILSDNSSRTFTASRSEPSNDVFEMLPAIESHAPTRHPSSSTPTYLPTSPWRDRTSQEPSSIESTTESTTSVRPTSSLTRVMSLDFAPTLAHTTPWPTSYPPTRDPSSSAPTYLPSPWPTLNRRHPSDSPTANGESQVPSREASSIESTTENTSSDQPTTFLTTLMSLEIAPVLSPTTPFPTSADQASDLAIEEFKFADYIGSSYHHHDSVTFQSEWGVRCSNSEMAVASQVESISIPYYYQLSGGVDLQPQVQRIESAVLSVLGAKLLDCESGEPYENGGRVIAIYSDETTTPSRGETSR